MLRGNSPARVDEKGRLKVPAQFKEVLDENYENKFFITSIDGQYVRVYPLEEWSKLEEKVKGSTFNKTRRKFMFKANYYGGMAEMDGQGRVLIPQVLREAAGMKGDVFVVGSTSYLEVWNSERVKPELEAGFTPEEEQEIDRWGV